MSRSKSVIEGDSIFGVERRLTAFVIVGNVTSIKIGKRLMILWPNKQKKEDIL